MKNIVWYPRMVQEGLRWKLHKLHKTRGAASRIKEQPEGNKLSREHPQEKRVLDDMETRKPVRKLLGIGVEQGAPLERQGWEHMSVCEEMREKQELVMNKSLGYLSRHMFLFMIAGNKLGLEPCSFEISKMPLGLFCAVIQKIIVTSSISDRNAIRGGWICISYFEELWVLCVQYYLLWNNSNSRAIFLAFNFLCVKWGTRLR